MAANVEGGALRVVGRYALHAPIAAGGMATVHFGRLLGPVGFSRTVAIKRLHPQYASDPEFVSMFLDEARLAARIRHPNVVPTLDVVAIEGELFLVMEYVPGESLAKLTRNQKDHRPSFRVISAVMAGTLHGLHAAHEAKDERGSPLGIVHRDVSPQNILVGTDGIPKILDFGVAKAAGRTQHTREGQIKGKLSYMPPEQLRGGTVTRAADIYAAGIVLWEVLTGQRLFGGDNEGVVIARILEGKVVPPSQVLALKARNTMTDRAMRELEQLDRVVLRALDMNPDRRYATAQEMAVEIERTIQPATPFEVSEWVGACARDVLATRANKVSEIESSSTSDVDHDKVMAALAQKSTLTAPQIQAMMNNGAGAGSGGPVPRTTVEATPPTTQPSTISVSTAARLEHTKQVRTVALAGAIAVLGTLLLGGAAAWHMRARSTATETEGTPTSVVMNSTPVSTTPAAPGPLVNQQLPTQEDAGASWATALGAQPPPSPSPGTRAGGGAPVVKPPANVVKPPQQPQPPPQPTTVAPPPSAKGDPCSPPYYFDAKGVKHYKEQCF